MRINSRVKVINNDNFHYGYEGVVHKINSVGRVGVYLIQARVVVWFDEQELRIVG